MVQFNLVRWHCMGSKRVQEKCTDCLAGCLPLREMKNSICKISIIQIEKSRSSSRCIYKYLLSVFVWKVRSHRVILWPGLSCHHSLLHIFGGEWLSVTPQGTYGISGTMATYNDIVLLRTSYLIKPFDITILYKTLV